jgi:hypothetical protein
MIWRYLYKVLNINLLVKESRYLLILSPGASRFGRSFILFLIAKDVDFA